MQVNYELLELEISLRALDEKKVLNPDSVIIQNIATLLNDSKLEKKLEKLIDFVRIKASQIHQPKEFNCLNILFKLINQALETHRLNPNIEIFNHLEEAKKSIRNIYRLIEPDLLDVSSRRIICEIIGEKHKQKYFLFGPMGHGKSSTGNALLKPLTFGEGDGSSPQTKTINFETSKDDSCLVIDCPGLGDSNIENLFFSEILNKKESLIKEGSFVIIFVVKFKNNHCEEFKNTAETFIRIFGKDAIKSFLILCILSDSPALDKFINAFENSDGYRYLEDMRRQSSSSDRPIQYCVWHKSFKIECLLEDFHNCVEKLVLFNSSKIRYFTEMSETYHELLICRNDLSLKRSKASKSTRLNFNIAVLIAFVIMAIVMNLYFLF